MLEQRGIVFECGRQQGVTGNEGDDVLRRVLELIPVRLFGQGVDVRPQLAGVRHEVGPSGRIVGSVVGVEEGLKRHLGVDNDVPGSRQMHDHVGPQPSFGALGRHLLLEVAVLDHPRHLHHTPELHLAPTATRGRGTQRGHEVARLGLELVLGVGQGPDLLAQTRVGLLTLELEESKPLFVAAELLAEGTEQLLDGLSALIEITARRLLGMGHAGVGELEELGVVLLERLARQLGEFTDELTPHVLGGQTTLLRRAALVLEQGLQGVHLGPGRCPAPRPGAGARTPTRAATRVETMVQATATPPPAPTTMPITRPTIMGSPCSEGAQPCCEGARDRA